MYVFMFGWSLPAFFFGWQDFGKTYVCFLSILCFFFANRQSLRVGRGGGGDFLAPFWICLCMYLCMYLSPGKLKIFESAGILSLALVNKIEKFSYLQHTLPEIFFIRSINFERVPEFCLSLCE